MELHLVSSLQSSVLLEEMAASKSHHYGLWHHVPTEFLLLPKLHLPQALPPTLQKFHKTQLAVFLISLKVRATGLAQRKVTWAQQASSLSVVVAMLNKNRNSLYIITLLWSMQMLGENFPFLVVACYMNSFLYGSKFKLSSSLSRGGLTKWATGEVALSF